MKDKKLQKLHIYVFDISKLSHGKLQKNQKSPLQNSYRAEIGYETSRKVPVTRP